MAFFLTVCALLTSCALCSPIGTAQPTVTAPSGVVIGVATTVPSGTTAVNKHVGIPFAKSPPLRFAPPEPAPSATQPIDASQTKPACIQQFVGDSQTQARTQHVFNNPGGPAPPESEDCLYLNIYAPATATKDSKLPVMFWSYGGAFILGDAGLLAYDGSSFAGNQEVVLVTHNYRTNVFGFPNSPEIPTAEQNAGFFDTRMALSWVQDNIEAFGGDKDAVTIFGESAGAITTKQLVAQPPNPRPFRAAILESQTTLPSSFGPEEWDLLAAAVGCGANNTQLACVRDVPADTIRSTIEQDTLLFFPVPNSVFVSDTRTAFTSGTAAKVPILLGSNKDEGDVFAYILGLDDPAASARTALQSLFPTSPAIQSLLGGLLDVTQLPYRAAATLITNLILFCPTVELAGVLRSAGYSVWRYHFSGVFPNTQIFPDAGAYHSSEITEVFGTYDVFPNPTQDQAKLSRYMQKAWADFAKDPSTGPGWPAYADGSVAELGGSGNTGGEMTIQASRIDGPCALPDPHTALVGL